MAKWWPAIASVTLVAASCTNSSDHGAGQSSAAGSSAVVTTSSEATDTLAPVHPPDPLVPDGTAVMQRAVVGTSIDSDGRVSGVAPSLPTNAPELDSGVLLLHDAPAGDATVTWSIETADGEQTLFVQHAAANPDTVLIAKARGDGHVSPGVYRVHFAVGAETRDAMFVVNARSNANGSAAGGLRRTTVTTAVTDTTEPTNDWWGDGGTETRAPPADCTEESHAASHCWGWFNDDPSVEPDTVPLPPCDSNAEPRLSLTQDDVSLGGEVAIDANTSGCDPAQGLSVAAGVAAGTPATVAQGGPDVRWSGNTCKLPGKSDLFGNIVTAQASVASSQRQSSQSIALREWPPLPVPAVISPEPGTTVHDGQTISFIILAMAFGATRGIKTLDVIGPDGAVVAHSGRTAPAAPCELTLERFIAIARGTYTVVDDGKPYVELMIHAETFDGSSTQWPMRWPKLPTWSGELTMNLIQQVTSGRQFQDLSADVIVSETGQNTLTGTINGTYAQILNIDECPSDTITKGTTLGTLAGPIDADGMHLQLSPGANSPPSVTPCSFGPPALMPNPLIYPQLTDMLQKLEPVGNGHYAAFFDVNVGGPGPYELKAALNLVPLAVDPVDAAAISMTAAQPPKP